jgi:Protein of unknown function (DUF3089)
MAPRPSPRPRRRTGLAVTAGVLLLGVALAACSSPSPPDAAPQGGGPPPSIDTTPAPTPTPTSAPASPITWLCRPGMADDPCASSLTATVVTGRGTTRIQHARTPAHPAIDCFYVYPTVSTQPTANANLTIDPEETAVAVAQAARFSQVCKVYAPMYRQLTVAAISGKAGVTGADVDIAYRGVLNAWNYYLAHYNDGRGVAVIGHSQGAALLIKLLQTQVDANPFVRPRLVSAILLGGNVTVPIGQTVGGTFAHIPACTNVTVPGCVIAYSSFDQVPPANSIFGRVSSPVNALSGQTVKPGEEVACVNPVAGTGSILGPPPAGATSTTTGSTNPTTTTTTTARATTTATSKGRGKGRAKSRASSTTSPGAGTATTGPASLPAAGTLSPYFPTTAFAGTIVTAKKAGAGGIKLTTPWVTFPGLYAAQCKSEGGATWLQVDSMARPADTRPLVKETLGPTWGLHLVDVNIALGNLVDDLQQQALNYTQ